MRIVVVSIIGAMLLGASQGMAAGMTDKEISAEAAARASILLSKTPDDEGFRFLSLAHVLNEEENNVVMTEAYLKRKTAPKPIETSMDQTNLLENIKERGLYLLKSRFPNNTAIGHVCLLYLTFFDSFVANDPEVLNGLAYLHSFGMKGKLKDLLKQLIDLEDIDKITMKPEKLEVSGLNETDEKMAKEAIRIASDILTEDSSSSAGGAILHYANHLLPGESMGCLLKLKLDHSINIEPMKSKFSTKKFAPYLLRRGNHYLEKAGKSKYNLHMASLYLRVAEQVMPNNNGLLIALEKREKLGTLPELSDLLSLDLVAMTTKKSTPEPTSSVTSNTDPTGPIIKFGQAELDKFSADVKIKRRKGGRGNGEDQRVTMTISFNNKLDQPIEGLQIIACVIGKPIKAKNDFRQLVAANALQSVHVPPGRSREPIVILDDKIKAYIEDGGTTYYGMEYASYFVVVKDGTGEIIQLLAKDSKTKAFAYRLKNKEFADALGLSRSMKFDRDGSRIFEK